MIPEIYFLSIIISSVGYTLSLFRQDKIDNSLDETLDNFKKISKKHD